MNYLVTGATGFIGRHLVADLLAREGGTVYALVRPGSQARFEALRRRNGDSDRVRAVSGDIAEPGCGVSDAAAEQLRGAHVIHLAAIYDLTADAAAMERANVDGTRNVVGLCNRIGATCLHHVSSIAVAGRHKGSFTEEMFDVGQEAAGELDHPYFSTKFLAERTVREDSRTPWRVYRPGMVIGSSATGEADRVDGPYYTFKLIQKMRDAVPSWMPFVGPEGGELNVVPVDFVARAIDVLVHTPGLDGRAFHLVDPHPLSLGDTLNTFCRAAHAPEFALRFDRRLGRLIPGNTVAMAAQLPAVQRVRKQLLDGLGIPEAAFKYMDYPARFDASAATAVLEPAGVSCPPLHTYAWKVWDYWERHLDPELPTPGNLRRMVSGKVVLVTGASSGIGRALANQLAGSGCTIIGVARNVEKLEEMKREAESHGGRVVIHPTDLSDPEACAALVQRVLEEEGRIDVLVNNAGRSIRRSVAESVDRFHDFERTMRINYFGAVALILAVLEHMKQRGEGHIVNITSIGGQTYPPRFAAYVASKAALDAFSRCLAPEVKAEGIHITTCHMPLVRTPMIAPTGIYKNFPTISPDEAADMIVQALISRPHEVSTRIGKFGELTHAIAPGLHSLIMGAAYSMLPDSAPRRDGEGDGARSESGGEMSIEAFALTQLMRGIHL